ncbi:hypothetical protein [Campylobacter curvus]|uniref:hypothetical protein n=1 Tax=Campylobacter curvus TaxID=200 RepID=UPI0019D0D1E1|nr:hypothetical protein [Campylobacter curvus]MBN7288682.1 hypothetical protein [Campylobacter curvus]
MSDIRLIPAPLDMEFELDEAGDEKFLREFNSVLPGDEDPLGAWLKRAKSRGETKDSDQVLLTLMIELHRKVDALSEYVRNEHKRYLPLSKSVKIDAIGFEYVRISEHKFEANKRYYARILMPVFPKRTIALYLLTLDERTAKIDTMHEEDESDWNAYVTARERVMIRELRSGS